LEDWLGQLDQLASLVEQVQLVALVVLVQLVSLVQWAIQGNREIRVYKVLRGRQDSPVLLVIQELWERLVGLGLLVRLVYKAQLESLERQDSRVQLDNKDPWVPQEVPDWLGRPDSKVPPV